MRKELCSDPESWHSYLISRVLTDIMSAHEEYPRRDIFNELRRDSY